MGAGRLPEPLNQPKANERNGYGANVVAVSSFSPELPTRP
jgi:hypothetical protein